MSKRFANAMNNSGGMSRQSRFVIPDPNGGAFFVELASGRRHEVASVVFVGVDLTVKDVLEKIDAKIFDLGSAREVVRSFLAQLPEYPIGGVISVRSGAPGLQLELVGRRASSGPHKALPG